MNVSDLSKNHLHGLERLLEDTLLPVEPRYEFIQKLKQELQTKISSSPMVTQSVKYHKILLALASVAGTSVLVTTSIRTVLSLIGVVSVIHLIKKQTPKKNLSPPQIVTG
jgi:hypothetical protein